MARSGALWVHERECFDLGLVKCNDSTGRFVRVKAVMVEEEKINGLCEVDFVNDLICMHNTKYYLFIGPSYPVKCFLPSLSPTHKVNRYIWTTFSHDLARNEATYMPPSAEMDSHAAGKKTKRNNSVATMRFGVTMAYLATKDALLGSCEGITDPEDDVDGEEVCCW